MNKIDFFQFEPAEYRTPSGSGMMWPIVIVILVVIGIATVFIRLILNVGSNRKITSVQPRADQVDEFGNPV